MPGQLLQVKPRHPPSTDGTGAGRGKAVGWRERAYHSQTCPLARKRCLDARGCRIGGLVSGESSSGARDGEEEQLADVRVRRAIYPSYVRYGLASGAFTREQRASSR